MARTRTAQPTQKIYAVGVAGAIVTIAIWAFQYYAHTDIPPQVASAATLIISVLIGYITPPGDDEVVAAVPDGASVTTAHVDVTKVDTE